MISRELAGAVALCSVFGITGGAVPLQCGGTDTPAELRTEDTAGDALWDLSGKFRAEGNDAAAKETLRYLVTQYPSNRHASAAKDLLATSGAKNGDVADVAADGG